MTATPAVRPAAGPGGLPRQAAGVIAAAVRRWSPGRPCDVVATLEPLRRGRYDPACFIGRDGCVWLAARTPEGPGTLRVAALPSLGEVTAAAWGPGAAWLLDGLPELLGVGDDPGGFRPLHPAVREGARRLGGWRVPRTRRVLDALVPMILEQKVATVEAQRSWRELLVRFGSPAPGPVPVALRVPPAAREWATLPSWEWHRAGVDDKRARTIVTAARAADGLQRTTGVDPPEARRRLMSLPGIGVWTAAETAQRAYGDADAVSVGDLHLPAIVGHALVGEACDDAGMLRLLEPYRGQRYRAVRCILSTGLRPKRRAPRAQRRDYRRF